jgi:hypothetical protein
MLLPLYGVRQRWQLQGLPAAQAPQLQLQVPPQAPQHCLQEEVAVLLPSLGCQKSVELHAMHRGLLVPLTMLLQQAPQHLPVC